MFPFNFMLAITSKKAVVAPSMRKPTPATTATTHNNNLVSKTKISAVKHSGRPILYP